MGDEKPMGQVIQIDEARIRDHLAVAQTACRVTPWRLVKAGGAWRRGWCDNAARALSRFEEETAAAYKK